jgi:hypothetical protein
VVEASALLLNTLTDGQHSLVKVGEVGLLGFRVCHSSAGRWPHLVRLNPKNHACRAQIIVSYVQNNVTAAPSARPPGRPIA